MTTLTRDPRTQFGRTVSELLDDDLSTVLVLAEIAYTVTDPPIKAIRRVLPPVRLGSVALDFGWSIIMLAVVILMGVASGLRFA